MAQRTANDADRVLAEIRALISVIVPKADRETLMLIERVHDLDRRLAAGEDLPGDWLYIHD